MGSDVSLSKAPLYFSILLLPLLSVVVSCTTPEDEEISVLDAELESLETDPSLADENEDDVEDSEFEELGAESPDDDEDGDEDDSETADSDEGEDIEDDLDKYEDEDVDEVA